MAYSTDLAQKANRVYVRAGAFSRASTSSKLPLIKKTVLLGVEKAKSLTQVCGSKDLDIAIV